MHEMSITQSVVDICTLNAGGKRVTEVTLEIGALSGVVPDAIEFCFEACTKGTPLEGAQLLIEQIPGRGRCRACAAEFDLDSYHEPCPACSGFGVEITSGEELRVRELVVD